MKLRLFHRYLLPLLTVLVSLSGPPAHGQKAPTTDEIAAWRKGAEQGDMASQGCLGAHYGNGQGVMQDEIEGYKWTLLAAAQGEAATKKNKLVAESRLSPEQLAAGRRSAAEWQAKFEKTHPAIPLQKKP